MTSQQKLPTLTAGRDRPATIIAPSILAADLSVLLDECQSVLDLGANWIHVDVMDGHFVPNLGFGTLAVSSLRKRTDAFLDCHLMVTNPKQWVEDFAKAGASVFTFHIETLADMEAIPPAPRRASVEELLSTIRGLKMYAGVALKPSTPAQLLFPYLDEGLIDMVLVMTVEPGFGGQKYMEEPARKCKVLRDRYPGLLIEVDGGIDVDSAAKVAAEGANVLVAGTSIFRAPSREHAINAMRGAVDAAATAGVQS